jgi:hypothetical protein
MFLSAKLSRANDLSLCLNIPEVSVWFDDAGLVRLKNGSGACFVSPTGMVKGLVRVSTF